MLGIYNTLKPGTKVDLIERVYKNKFLTLEGLEIIANSDTNKGSNITFAINGEKIMRNVKISKYDTAKLNLLNTSAKVNHNNLKLLLREKRIRYLLELEKNKVE